MIISSLPNDLQILLQDNIIKSSCFYHCNSFTAAYFLYTAVIFTTALLSFNRKYRLCICRHLLFYLSPGKILSLIHILPSQGPFRMFPCWNQPCGPGSSKDLPDPASGHAFLVLRCSPAQSPHLSREDVRRAPAPETAPVQASFLRT